MNKEEIIELINEELRKQLEEYKLNHKQLKDLNKIQKSFIELKNQQQEFIKYLEEEKDYFLTWSGDMYEDVFDIRKSINCDIYKEVYRILEKYKEIIGDEK